MLSDRCLSVCPVCDVDVLWPNDWMDQDETWHAGLGPGHILLDRDPVPLPPKGQSTRPILAYIGCDQMAGWINMPVRTEVGLDPSDGVRWGPSSPPPIFSPYLVWPNGWMDQDATRYGDRSQPWPHC